MTPLEQYVIKLSADLDTGSFETAKTAINDLVHALKGMARMAIPVGVGISLAAVVKATTGLIKSTADAEMQYKRLGTQMWITGDSAKALSVAMKTMGVSEQDIAWVPELREQFFRLRQEMNELATPVDAEQQFKWIREIGYGIQSLQVKMKALREWIAYYLIKYMDPFIRRFQGFIQWLNERLERNLPEVAKKIANVLSSIVGVAYSAFYTIKSVLGAVYDFVEDLPASVKKWAGIFAVVGAAITAGPFGRLVMILGTAMLLIQDFVYYMKGWNSSKTLAPMWETVLKFMRSDTVKTIGGVIQYILGKISGALDTIFRVLGNIAKEINDSIDWGEIENTWVKTVDELTKAFRDLKKSISELYRSLDENQSPSRLSKGTSYWKVIGEAITTGIKSGISFVGVFAKIIEALALVAQGRFQEAGKSLLGAASQLAGGLGGFGKAQTHGKYDNLGGFRFGSSFSGGANGGMASNDVGNLNANLDDNGNLSAGSVTGLAGSLQQGYQWMDPDGSNTDPAVQCASFASAYLRNLGINFPAVDDIGSMQTAYGNAMRGPGYTPDAGDAVFFPSHVGISLGGNMMINRQSDGGIKTIDLDTAQEWFGNIIGYGSTNAYIQAAGQGTAGGGYGGAGNSLVGNGSSFFNSNSYAAASSGYTPMVAPEGVGSQAGTEVSIGAIQINVSKAPAQEGGSNFEDISERIAARAGRGVLV